MDYDFNAKMEKARENVRLLDEVEGFKDRELTTIASSIRAGLRHPETNAGFDALVMIEDLIRSNRIEGGDYIDISHLDRAEVLMVLFNNAVEKIGRVAKITAEQAMEFIELNDSLRFDYVLGIPIKCNLAENPMFIKTYDREHGDGEASKALEPLIEGRDIKKYELILASALAGYRIACYGGQSLMPEQEDCMAQAFLSGIHWLNSRNSVDEKLESALQKILLNGFPEPPRQNLIIG